MYHERVLSPEASSCGDAIDGSLCTQMRWGLQRHDGAGRSAEQKYKELRKAWQRRMFGRWGRWVVPALLGLVFLTPILNGGWRPFGTSFLVAAGAGWIVVQHLAAPDHIQRWQRGAWGEQWTAKELRPLKKEGWFVRHDLQNGRGNRDHILVGSSVYLLDTKNLADELTLEGTALRVRRIDQPRDSYVMDRLTENMKVAARSVNRDIRRVTGERVWVHPVVVLWGQFDAGEAEADGVFYVHGRMLRQWLKERPIELDDRRRAAVCAWAKAAPAASHLPAVARVSGSRVSG